MTGESLGAKIIADLQAKVSALEKERDHLKAVSAHAHEHWAIQGRGRIAAEARAEALEGLLREAAGYINSTWTRPDFLRAKQIVVAADAALEFRCPTCGSTDRKVSLWLGKPVNTGSEQECLNPWHAALESPREAPEAKGHCTGTLVHSEFVPCPVHDH